MDSSEKYSTVVSIHRGWVYYVVVVIGIRTVDYYYYYYYHQIKAGWVLAIIVTHRDKNCSALTSHFRCRDAGSCFERRRSSSGYWIREHIHDPGAPPQRMGSLHAWVVGW